MRLSYTEDLQNQNEFIILEETNYYPFGLQYGGYNKDVKQVDFWDYANMTQQEIIENAQYFLDVVPIIKSDYKYKYQGQERQDELNLNWDSFKWRNYDYAIGRFMLIDPIGEDYYYNSPYAFAENRVMDGRELEGLEWSVSRGDDGNYTATLRIQPIKNNSDLLTQKDVQRIQGALKSGTEANLSGKLEDGSQLTVEVIFDENSTIGLEVNSYIDVTGTDTANEPNGSSAPFTAAGIVNTTEDNQNNKIQIGAVRSFYEWSDENGDYVKRKNLTDKELQRTTSHEAAHTGGLRHPRRHGGGIGKQIRQDAQRDPQNLLHSGGEGINMLPIQRTYMVEKIEEQQSN